jgi:hypothetical protein
LGRQSQRQWIAIDEYFSVALVDTDSGALVDTDSGVDDALHAALAASDAAALPAIAVSPVQGYDGFVMVLVKTP